MKPRLILFTILFFCEMIQAQTCYTFTPVNSPLAGNNVLGVYIDNDGSKWFATNFGAYHLHANGWDAYNSFNSGIVTDWLRDITRAGNNDLFFASNLDGVSRFDGTAWTTYTQANGLPSNIIHDIITDSNGDVWVATSNGVARFNGTSWEIKNTSNTSAFPSPTVKAITEVNGNTLWMAAEPISSWVGGASYFNTSTSCINYTTSNSTIGSNATQAIVQVNPNEVWVGSWNGISILNLLNNQFTNYTTSNSTLPSNYVSDIELDFNSRVWIGNDLGASQGLVHYDIVNGTWSAPYNTSNSCLTSNTINDIEIDNQGNVWLGTTYGATVLNINGINVNGNFNSITLWGESTICEGDSTFLAVTTDGGFGTFNFDIPGVGSFQNWNENDTIWFTPNSGAGYSLTNVSDALGYSPVSVNGNFSQTLNPSSDITENISICSGQNYQLPNGNVVSQSGTYLSPFTTMLGCDSTITTNLTVVTPNIATTTNGATISANAPNATIQWINCANGQPIVGATSQSYTATANGNYAAIVIENGCVDTTDCVTISALGIETLSDYTTLLIYPNPSKGKVHVQSLNFQMDAIQITDMTGRSISKEKLNEVLEVNLSPGMYHIVGMYQGNVITLPQMVVIN